jgi:hypothetical protein
MWYMIFGWSGHHVEPDIVETEVPDVLVNVCDGYLMRFWS